MRRLLMLLLALLSMSVLAACGNKGPLVRAHPAPASGATPAPAPASSTATRQP